MKTPVLLSSTLLGGLALCLAAAPALAQTEPSAPPPPAPASAPPPNYAPITVLGGGGIGIGAEAFLNGVAGAEFVYDQPMFHIEAVLGYRDVAPSMGPSDSTFAFGVAGWYHLARGTNADFSIGGGVGINYDSLNGGTTSVVIEPGAEGRVFLTPNFALAARVGISIQTGNNNSGTVFQIGGQEATSFGFTYFFR